MHFARLFVEGPQGPMSFLPLSVFHPERLGDTPARAASALCALRWELNAPSAKAQALDLLKLIHALMPSAGFELPARWLDPRPLSAAEESADCADWILDPASGEWLGAALDTRGARFEAPLFQFAIAQGLIHSALWPQARASALRDAAWLDLSPKLLARRWDRLDERRARLLRWRDLPPGRLAELMDLGALCHGAAPGPAGRLAAPLQEALRAQPIALNPHALLGLLPDAPYEQAEFEAQLMSRMLPFGAPSLGPKSL